MSDVQVTIKLTVAELDTLRQAVAEFADLHADIASDTRANGPEEYQRKQEERGLALRGKTLLQKIQS